MTVLCALMGVSLTRAHTNRPCEVDGKKTMNRISRDEMRCLINSGAIKSKYSKTFPDKDTEINESN